jgi:hypothetical protein
MCFVVPRQQNHPIHPFSLPARTAQRSTSSEESAGTHTVGKRLLSKPMSQQHSQEAIALILAGVRKTISWY